MDTEMQKEVTVVDNAAKIQYVKMDKVASEPNPEVQKQLAIIETVRLQKEAMEKADAGDYKQAKILLGKAVSFVTSNASVIPDSNSYIANLNNMTVNFNDHLSYTTKGTKMARAFYTANTLNRVTSMDYVASYGSSTQEKLLKSFNDSQEKDEDSK